MDHVVADPDLIGPHIRIAARDVRGTALAIDPLAFARQYLQRLAEGWPFEECTHRLIVGQLTRGDAER